MPDGYPQAPLFLSGGPDPPDRSGGQAVPSPPFATVEDLEERWHEFTPTERPRVEATLADASDLIMTTCPDWAHASEATLRRITCAATKRALLARDDMAGISQGTQTAGAYSESVTYANPSGDIYLTASERESLGGDGGAWSYDMARGMVGGMA